MATTAMSVRVSSRPALPALAKWTIATLVACALQLTFMQVFFFRSFDPPVALIFGVPALIVAVLIAMVRRPWVPLLGTTYWALFLAANAPYVGHDLVHPEFPTMFANGLILMVPALAGVAASIGAAVQNYRARGAGAEVSARPTPRWFNLGLMALVALVLGAIAAAALAPAGAASGVSPEALAELPALTTAQHHFGPTELHARVGETVALRLENADASGHSFDIDELGVHVPMAPGKPALALFKVTTPGTYTFYCSIPGHREAGMVGTLVVEP